MINKNKIMTLERIKEIIHGLFKLSLAMGLLIGLLYLRLLPRVSRDLWENMTHRQLFLTVVIIILILLNIKSLLDTLYGKNKVTWVLRIFAKVIIYITSCFVELYETFWSILDFLGKKYFNYPFLQFEVIRVFVRGFIKREFFIWNILFLLSLKYLPKIVICLALLVDVFFYHRFYYTFLCIPYLLLPLLEKIIIYILDNYYETNFPYAFQLIEFKNIPETNNASCSYKPEIAKNPPAFVKDFGDFFNNHFLFLVELKNTLNDYQLILDSLKTVYLDLLLAVLRLITYFYILAYGL